MKVENLVQTCWACPSQWEFTTDEDRPVYVRFRHGWLSIRVGEPGRSDGVIGREILGIDLSSQGLDGVIAWDEVEPRIKNINISIVMGLPEF